MPIILLLNLKGGVAKTTNAVAIAETLAYQGKKVLMIDADHQSMAGELLLGEKRLEISDFNKHTLHDILAAMISNQFELEDFSKYVVNNASQVLELKPRINCIPCTHRIDEFQTNMAKARKGHLSNEDFLHQLNKWRRMFNRYCSRHYDYTIIDCPPSFAIQVIFILGFADYFIVPTLPDRLSVRGSLYLLERLRLRGQTRIKCLGTLWSMVRVQVNKHLEIMEDVKNQKSEYANMPKPFKSSIPNTTYLADAMDSSRSFETYKDKYHRQIQTIFHDLCLEIEKRSLEV